MKNKYVGILILIIVVLFLLIIMSFNQALESIVNENCTHGDMCPMHTTLKTQKMISYSLLGLLAIVGTFIALFMREEKKETPEPNYERLNDEEKNIVNIIKNNQGATYQSDLIKETNLTKVKMTRLLDKLEGKHVIERKRRGMTNIIVLK